MKGALIGAGVGALMGAGIGLWGAPFALGAAALGAANSYRAGGMEGLSDFSASLAGGAIGGAIGYGIGEGINQGLSQINTNPTATQNAQFIAKTEASLRTDETPQPKLLIHKANAELQPGYVRRYVSEEEYLAIYDNEYIMSNKGSTYFTPNDVGINTGGYMSALQLEGSPRYGFVDVPYRNFDYYLAQTTVNEVPGGSAQQIIVQKNIAISARGGRLVRFDTMEQKTFLYGENK